MKKSFRERTNTVCKTDTHDRRYYSLIDMKETKKPSGEDSILKKQMRVVPEKYDIITLQKCINLLSP